jgi:hypothetical protein
MSYPAPNKPVDQQGVLSQKFVRRVHVNDHVFGQMSNLTHYLE